MGNTAAKALIIAAISALIGFLTNQKVPATQAAITVPMAAWLLFQFRGYDKAWTSLGNFQNPVLFGINAFFVSFIYVSWRMVPLTKSLYLSTGVFLLGGALSLVIYNYWTIGE